MKEKTMKIRNTTGWTHEVHNPAYVEFPPNQVVEVSYDLGSHLVIQPEYEEVKESKPAIRRASKRKKEESEY